ncbi:MAG: glycosyltransferase family 4 protein [Pirellulales bacterium]|nr:glycosyltransferase family 4 protein [Pirellulales bacterium]
MKTQIAIVTYDLLPKRKRLLPWRTVCEVVAGMRRRGYDARLISINRNIDHPCVSQEYDVPVWFYQNIRVCRPGADDFYPDLVYWPVAWRDALKPYSHWHGWDCPTVVYQDGGCHRLPQVLAAMRYMPLTRLKNLMVEAFLPKRLLVRKLKKRRVSGVLCMTEFTRQDFVNAGWPSRRSIAVLPGMPAKEEPDGQTQCHDELDFANGDQDYVLFLGNPLPVRGINVLLSAAPKVFERCKNLKIVCLLRPDPGREMEIARQNVLRSIDDLNMRERFICVTKNLSSREIQASIKRARAVVMPFLYIPTEIPLGILEAMQLGTPVITTQSGGTSEYISKGGWIIPPGKVAPLSEAIISAALDDETRREKVEACLAIMGSHPTWESVANSWIDFGESVCKSV